MRDGACTLLSPRVGTLGSIHSVENAFLLHAVNAIYSGLLFEIFVCSCSYWPVVSCCVVESVSVPPASSEPS